MDLLIWILWDFGMENLNDSGNFGVCVMCAPGLIQDAVIHIHDFEETLCLLHCDAKKTWRSASWSSSHSKDSYWSINSNY